MAATQGGPGAAAAVLVGPTHRQLTTTSARVPARRHSDSSSGDKHRPSEGRSKPSPPPPRQLRAAGRGWDGDGAGRGGVAAESQRNTHPQQVASCVVTDAVHVLGLSGLPVQHWRHASVPHRTHCSRHDPTTAADRATMTARQPAGPRGSPGRRQRRHRRALT